MVDKARLAINAEGKGKKGRTQKKGKKGKKNATAEHETLTKQVFGIG